MILLPLIPGLAVLAGLLPGRPGASSAIAGLALLLLALSAVGRWPVTATLFCMTILGLMLSERDLSIWVYLSTGLLLAVYLAAVEAREVLPSLSTLPKWIAEQLPVFVSWVVGLAAVALAVSIPLVAPRVVVVVSTAVASLLFCWVVPVRTHE